MNASSEPNRRKFFKLLAAGGLGLGLSSIGTASQMKSMIPLGDEKPATNISDALKHPRMPESMPGRFPGKVVKVDHPHCVENDEIIQTSVNQMLTDGMLGLTGLSLINEAWLMFVKPGEKIGLKVNPIGEKMLSTSIQLVKAVIAQLKNAGIPEKDIMIWDRREFQLKDAGFVESEFPGIRFRGTEQQDEKGSFFGADGLQYAEKNIDKEWFYWADTEEEYDAYTLPYMVNSGKHSYFSKICTQEVDKIINLPILKNAGSSITLCLKNLAYGAITNTGRLHKQLWSETSAEVCAFPPLRDKVVLNIADGIKGCYDGGPGANPQFICNYNTLILGTDPVAVDRIGYETVLKKRIEMEVQKEDNPKGRKFLDLASNLGLGVADLAKIDLKTIKSISN